MIIWTLLPAQGRQQEVVIVSIVSFIFFMLVASYFLVIERRKRAKVEKRLRKEIDDQRMLEIIHSHEMQTIIDLVEGLENERKQVAIEIRDKLGSILTTVGMFSDSIANKERTIELKDIAERISEASFKASDELIQIASRLDSGLLNQFGLNMAIQELLEEIKKSEHIDTKAEVEISEKISTKLRLQVYQIIMELIIQTLRHPKYDSIRIEISEISNELSIIYEDKGVASMAEQSAKSDSLKNVEQLIDELEGEMKVDTVPDRGSTFILEIPLA